MTAQEFEAQFIHSTSFRRRRAILDTPRSNARWHARSLHDGLLGCHHCITTRRTREVPQSSSERP